MKSLKIIFYFLFSIFYFFVGIRTLYAAEIYFGAHQKETEIGKSIEVGVLLDTQGEAINALEGEIIIPSDSFDFLDIRDGNSIISFWVKQPHFFKSAYEERVLFSGIIPGGFSGRGGYLFSIVLKTKTYGNFTFSAEKVKIFINDSNGTEAQVTTSPLIFKVIEKTPTTSPDFLRPYDNVPPEIFTPLVSHDNSLFDGNWFLVFATQDKGSGIDHYEVLETKEQYSLQNVGSQKLYWKVAQSPYVLNDQTLSSYIYLKAVDKDNNERFSMLAPQNVKEASYKQYFVIFGIIIVLVAIFIIFITSFRKNI